MDVEVVGTENNNCVKEVPGITGEVRKYGDGGKLEVPYIKFEAGRLEKYKLSVIRQMVKPMAGAQQDISLYISTQEGVFKVGAISGVQVESLVSMVGEENITASVEDGITLTGTMVYVLSE